MTQRFECPWPLLPLRDCGWVCQLGQESSLEKLLVDSYDEDLVSAWGGKATAAGGDPWL
jgi:hypothetical protein